MTASTAVEDSVPLVVAVSVSERTAPPPAGEDLLANAEALFKEARRRTRRRRSIRLVAALVVVAGGVFTVRVGLDPPATTALTSAPPPVVNEAAFANQGILAFVSRGQLWVLDGNRLTVVSRPYQQASSPAFSPNGRWLTYTLGNGLYTWLARSDGSGPRLVATGGAMGGWLPDGRLVAGTGIWALAPSGVLTRVAARPAGLIAWSPDGGRYVFVGSTMTGPFTGPREGVERLQVSSTLMGRRTTWYQVPVSYTRPSGLRGPFIDGAVVLAHDGGILFRTDPGEADDADGSHLYEIRARGDRPKDLGVTVGLPITVGPNGSFAITSGANRYAWQTKAVETCSATTAACAPLATARRMLSFDPAYSPDGKALAFVEAPSSGAVRIGQATVQRWYATHTLWVARAGSRAPSRVDGTDGASTPT